MNISWLGAVLCWQAWHNGSSGFQSWLHLQDICVLEAKPESNAVSLSFLYPHGPANSFVYTSPPDELFVDANDVIMIVNPITATGKTYTLSQSKIKKASNIIN